MTQGTYRYPNMDRVQYGRPFAEALAEERGRLDARRVFLIAGGTLSRETGFVDAARATLGNHVTGTWTRIGAHTPRIDVVEAASAARAVGADLLVTMGGGSVTDAAKMIGMCLANDVFEPRNLVRLCANTGADGVTRRPKTQAGIRTCRSRPRCRPVSSPRLPAAPTPGWRMAGRRARNPTPRPA